MKMKKQLLLAAALVLSSAAKMSACTDFIAGKGATTDGSVLCTYNADDYGMFTKLCHYAAGKHAKGAMREIIDYDTHESHGFIPEAPVTYNVIGNINEWQLCIGESTYGGRDEMVNKQGQIDYGSLMYLGLQRAKTAREAIKVMTQLVEKYGYISGGESFTICDPNEAWIMEMQGCGDDPKQKVVWCAVRIPDNALSGHANQSRIGLVSSYDTDVICSKNMISFARQKGWFTGKDNEFNWKMAYAKPDFSGRRICDARVWSFFRRFDKGMDRYLPWALGKDPNAEDMPLWIIKTDYFKDIVAANLRRKVPGPGYFHAAKWLPASYFEELRAEVRDAKGKWQQIRKRNEALDLWVYSLAVCDSLGFGAQGRMSWDRPPPWALALDNGNSELISSEERRAEQKAVKAQMTGVRNAIDDGGWDFERRY